jgi:N-succinyldiaminopimelate aminotransferase
MNSRLSQLQPYPFEQLRLLLADVKPAALPAVNLSIGEPKHATPPFITAALAQSAQGTPSGLSVYPATAGTPALREAIARWLKRRFQLDALDPALQVLPVNGSREALFALAQTVIDPRANAWVISPNPFYQIYEGAALLAGGQPYYVDQSPERGFRCDWASVPAEVWATCAMVFVCSPGNPTGAVMPLSEWQFLFELADRYGFVIAADECYSEIYHDEAHPPLGALQAAQLLGRSDYKSLIAFGSLSKRSSVPGLRSGYVAGDARLLKDFLLYRTYHGSAMSPAVQAASVAAWNDELHVQDNRRLYREKFAALIPLFSSLLEMQAPQAGFYLWGKLRPEIARHADRTAIDQWFIREAIAHCNVAMLPGSLLARPNSSGQSPGAGFVRIALVEPLDTCVLGARRLVEQFATQQFLTQ